VVHSVECAPDFFINIQADKNETLDDAKNLLTRIATVNNIYGFCARHYIDENRDVVAFILDIYRAILEKKTAFDTELMKDITDFGRKTKLIKELQEISITNSFRGN